MKKITMFILLAVVPVLLRAQGTVYFSNLGQTSAGSTAIGSDFWIAQTFGPSYFSSTSYELNSVQLLINSTSGNANGLTVSIYSSGSGSPRSPGVLVDYLNFSSSADGIFTYTASDITLNPRTYYFIVVTATTPVATGAYSWSAANTLNHDGGWPLYDFYYTSNNGFNWGGPLPPTGTQVFQFAIYATPVPEPAVGALLGLSLVGLGLWRLRRGR